jgi:hypothetical protein
MRESQPRRHASTALATALVALLLVGGCGRSERSRERRSVTANAAAKADKPQPGNAALDDSGVQEDESAATDERETASSSGGSRGRQARCEFNDEPAQACTFTQVLGDGSFDVETSDRIVRMLVGGQEAAAFEVFGPERRVPLPGNFRRDRSDPACWVADDNSLPLYRVCAR